MCCIGAALDPALAVLYVFAHETSNRPVRGRPKCKQGQSVFAGSHSQISSCLFTMIVTFALVNLKRLMHSDGIDARVVGGVTMLLTKVYDGPGVAEGQFESLIYATRSLNTSLWLTDRRDRGPG
jgi:hypothetical protein